MNNYVIIACVLAVVAGLFYVQRNGYRLCQGEVAIAKVESVETHEKIEQKIMQLPDPDLDKRLSRWMRD